MEYMKHSLQYWLIGSSRTSTDCGHGGFDMCVGGGAKTYIHAFPCLW